MSCRCCKRDGNRGCKTCFDNTELAGTFEPPVYTLPISAHPNNQQAQFVSLVTGDNSNNTGKCLQWSGGDLDNMGAYFHSREYSQWFPSFDPANDTEPRTTTEDKAGNQVIDRRQSMIRHLVTGGRIYPYIGFRTGARGPAVPGGGVNPAGLTPQIFESAVHVSSQFYVPPSSWLENGFSQQYTYTFGHDFHGDINDIPRYVPPVFWTTGSGLSLAFTVLTGFRSLFDGHYVDALIGQLDPNTSNAIYMFDPDVRIYDTYALPAKDRPLRITSTQTINKPGEPRVRAFDSGMTVEQYYQTGMTIRVCLEQISVTHGTEGNPPADFWDLVFEETIECLNTGVKRVGIINRRVPRCWYPYIEQWVYSATNQVVAESDKFPVFTADNPSLFVVSPVNTWWITELNNSRLNQPGLNQYLGAHIGFIGRMAVEEKNGNTDEPWFRCRLVRCFRSGGNTPYAEFFPLNGDDTIYSGRVIEIDAKIGDSYEVFFDNMGEYTTEVTDVALGLPICTSVDKTTETFGPFEQNKFTFSGPLPNVPVTPPAEGTVTFTHDQSGDKIVSPFELKFRSTNLFVAAPPP